MAIQLIKFCKIKPIGFSGIVLFWLLSCTPAIAEVVPDTTLPINSTVTSQDNISLIEGGTQAGGNLFHSFREFSIPAESTAFFNNIEDVQNIISRVTGGMVSNIDGIIQANGSANLFLLNPSGIIFGSNASLNIGGSFVASTANSLKFADGAEFSATVPQASSVLTVSVPTGLQFGSTTGSIVNQSQASQNETVNSIGSPVGLQVQSGKTLALVGGDVSLQNGNLTAIGGRIELGSIADGFVNLSQIDAGYTFDYADVQNFRDIQLSQDSFVDASDFEGNAIQLQGRNITLSENSLVFSINFESITGGNVAINATESVKLSGGSNIITTAEGEGRAGDVSVKALNSIELIGTAPDGAPSAVASEVCALSSDCQGVTGSSGDLAIETGRLSIRDGAQVGTTTYGVGSAGNLSVKALDSVELVGTRPDGDRASGLFAQVEKGATGDGGNLTIETGRLTVLGGAQISTAARTEGNGGTLTINASDSIQLSGISPTADPAFASSGVFVSAEPGAIGNAGNLNITTKQLTVEDGAKISADNYGTGLGGNATLNVNQLIIQGGGLVGAGSFGEGPGGTLTINAAESVEVIAPGTIGSIPVNRTLFTQAEGSGDAGNLNISTGKLIVQDGADVTVSSIGTGNAGNLTVQADSIELDNNAALRATTASGNGGNIALQLQDLLLLRRNSQVSSTAGTAQTGGDGGNITIASPFIISFPAENNDITANAFEGRGGFIQITAQGVFGIERRQQLTGLSDITAFSQQNPQLNGVVEIITPDVELQNSLTQLAANFANPDSVVAGSCLARRNVERGSFTVTGTGGLPASPYEAMGSRYGVSNIQPIGANSQVSKPATIVATAPWKRGEPIREAQGMTVTADGRTIVGTNSQIATLVKPKNLICPSN
jgi:filamentous hemagglutinin family protein